MSDIPTSGAISLNQMHTEAGGTSGQQASMNDADIRGLIGKGSASSMSFNEWYGASGAEVVVCVKGYKTASRSSIEQWGYSSIAPIGSITGNSTAEWANNGSYVQFIWSPNYARFSMRVNTTLTTNSGFSNLKLDIDWGGAGGYNPGGQPTTRNYARPTGASQPGNPVAGFARYSTFSIWSWSSSNPWGGTTYAGGNDFTVTIT
jgi:hypothetical protein